MRRLAGLFLLISGLMTSAVPAAARDIALIIANSNYAEMGVLKNPINDMNRMSATLSSMGFEVRRAADLTRPQMSAALLDFARDSRGAETAMIFYSGHGFEADGINYLIPVDYAPRHPADVKFAAIKLDDAMEAVAGATRLSVVVLDACRNNPLSGTRGGGRGLARVTARPSQVVAYSTAPGQVAQDGYGGVSPYTQALSEMMQANPAMDVRRLFTSLSSRTTELAQTEQVPYAEFGAFNANHVSLTGDVPQALQPQPLQSALPVQPSPAEMLALWDAIKDSGDPAALENFEKAYPSSPLAFEAQRRRLALAPSITAPRNNAPVPAVPVLPAQPLPSQPQQIEVPPLPQPQTQTFAALAPRPQPSVSGRPYDGNYSLEISCEAVRSKSKAGFIDGRTGFADTHAVTVTGGSFVLREGTEGSLNHAVTSGTVSTSGALEIDGFVVRDGTRRSIRMTPTSTLKASGKRGDAYCEVTLRKP